MKRIRIVFGLWLFAAPLTLVMASTPASLPPELQGAFMNAAKELRCPTCTGLSVLDSDAPFSLQIKELVAEQVKAGKSTDQVRDFFVQRYGPWILREPPKTGFSSVAWLLPITFLLGGPLLLWLVIWRRRQSFDTGGVRATGLILQEFDDKVSKQRLKVEGGS